MCVVVMIPLQLSILQNTAQAHLPAGLLTAQLWGEPVMSRYRCELGSAQPVQQDIVALDSGKLFLTGPAWSGATPSPVESPLLTKL